MITEVLSEVKTQMEKATAAIRDGFANVRTGRANPALLQNVQIDYYGTMTPLPQLASVQNQDARSLLITPYDKSALQSIEKAIREMPNLGANPSNDGNVVRVTLPELTEERRRDYVKMVKNRAEEGRIAVRAARRKAKDELDKLKQEVGEDEVGRAEKELESITKSFIDQIDSALSKKEAELLEV
ncbi:ribosome recycling factor [Canibacter sp. lx-72]|uniref:ribosome recycling factor n=1 Tax=Canibacter zhuwentaonis TaxID=2837491 RepID=UPI001BDC8EBE|nr:ribosome recycling factor [Canibacter zhuwentaonis]